jgi:hypothetical protein
VYATCRFSVQWQNLHASVSSYAYIEEKITMSILFSAFNKYFFKMLFFSHLYYRLSSLSIF